MRRKLRLVALLLAALGVAALWWAPRRHALPERLRLDALVRDLATPLDADVVVEQAAAEPVRQETLQPDPFGSVVGGARRALLAMPPSTLRFRLRVPPGGVLEAAAGVESPGKRKRDAAGVRFAIAVDGREAWARTVNPGRSRHDRLWFATRIALPAVEREVEVTLTTRVDGDGPLAGRPGWSHLRLVRETWHQRQPARDDAPNVLVVLVDTLRADRVGSYGAVPSPTPALDRLAAGGLVFERAVSQSSWTLTSVASLFTGLHPRSHGVFGLTHQAAVPAGVARDTEWSFLADTVPTLAELASRAGVTTYGTSANPLVSDATNLARGFETFDELRGPHWPPAATVNEGFLRWLRANRRHRFFAYLHYMDVHGPYAPPADLRPPAPPERLRPLVVAGDSHALSRALVWQGAPPLSTAELDHLRALYVADVRAWDRAFADLLRGLADLGVDDSTVVIVTADHGEEFLEHGRLGHGSQLYDETIRVPLLIAGPGVGRGRIGAQAQGIDLLPTVAALLGMPSPAELPGRNLLAAPEDRPALVETRYGAGAPGSPVELVALRTAGWKLVHAPTAGRYELYDLERDPGEQQNRYPDAPEGAALADRLAGWQAPPPPRGDGQDPGLVQRLRALGYVE